MEKFKKIVTIIIIIYLAIGFVLGIYWDFELIKDDGIIAYLFRGERTIIRMIGWPYFLFFV